MGTTNLHPRFRTPSSMADHAEGYGRGVVMDLLHTTDQATMPEVLRVIAVGLEDLAEQRPFDMNDIDFITSALKAAHGEIELHQGGQNV